MQYTDFKTMFAELTTIPSTYYSWPEGAAPTLPYLVWYFPNSDNFAADNSVYQNVQALNIELYTKNKSFATEALVEAVLNKYGFVWDKTESYISSEHMYEVLYETEAIING